MKQKEIDIIGEKSKESLNNLFIKSFEDLFKHHEDFVDVLTKNVKEETSRISEFDDPEQIFKFCLSLNESKLKIFESYYNFLKNFSTENTIQKVHETIVAETANLPLILKWDQEAHNFSKENVKGIFLKVLVSLKYRAFKTSRLLAGIFKRKEYKNNYKWKRNIPFRETINFYYANRLPGSLNEHTAEIIKKIGEDLIEINEELIKYDNFLIACCFTNEDKNELLLNTSSMVITKLDNSRNDLHKLIDALATAIEKEIQHGKSGILEDFKGIGTVTLPFNKYSSEKNEKINLAVLKKYKLIDERKHLFFKGIFNKFEFTFNVNAFQYSLIINSFPVISKVKTNLNSRLGKVLTAFDSEIDSTIKDLKNCGSSKQELEKLLTGKKNILHERIDNGLIIEFVDTLREVNYGNVLSDYLKSIETSINIFSKDYLFVRPGDLKYGVEKKDFHKFPPKFIIQSLFLLSYYSLLKKQIEESTVLYNSFNTKIINLGHVTEYNLNAALDQLEREEIELCLETAEEGLIRVKNRKKDIYNTLITSLENHITVLKKITEKLLEKTNELKNTEKIINLKIRATKEKTISELKNLLNNSFNNLKSFIKRQYTKFSLVLNSALKRYSRLKTRVGLADKENEISESISEYLSDTAASLEKIPPVYKNLFSNVQINDEMIFVGRSGELDKFESAYNKWYGGKLSSLVIVGEKGSGTSSLFNIASRKFDKNVKLCRREFSKTIVSEKIFIEEISRLLKLTDINSVEEIINKINTSDERYVVLVENLEDFYLKTINGFMSIHLLIDIMSATHNKVFWVATCAKYSWNYLVKVVNIQDYFVFKIELNELTDTELEEIIYKRHNISGYNLVFLPTKEQKFTKVFKKLNEKEKAVFLKEEYFETITKLTQGNIALSLFLWLRSIEKIDNDTVYVSTSIDIDFSFLNNMSDVKIFSIAALIMHDGLSLEEHSQVLNVSKVKSKFIFDSLIEDGIIFRRNEKYKINFQLYRPLVNLLKNRNIFH